MPKERRNIGYTFVVPHALVWCGGRAGAVCGPLIRYIQCKPCGFPQHYLRMVLDLVLHKSQFFTAHTKWRSLCYRYQHVPFSVSLSEQLE